jgi:hypothetical protein
VRKGKYLNRVNTGSEWAGFMRQAGFVDPEPGWFTPHQLGMIVARNP